MSSEGDGFMRVFLIRHAESYSNTQGRMMSTTDLALTEKGIRQAERAGIALHTALRGKERLYVFSSPLLRTWQTAEAVLRQFPAAPAVRETADLREMELGLLEGLTWQERGRLYPQVCLERGLSEAENRLQMSSGGAGSSWTNRLPSFPIPRPFWSFRMGLRCGCSQTSCSGGRPAM